MSGKGKLGTRSSNQGTQEILNRVGGANGCDILDTTDLTLYPEGIASLIVEDDDTIIESLKAGKDDLTLNVLTKVLGRGALITFRNPVTEIKLTAGRVILYFV